MRRRSGKIGATLLAGIACCAAAAPTAQAAQQQPAPSARASALTDTLGTTLGGLLGNGQQQQLQGLLAQLQSGQAPTGSVLAPLQTLLTQLAATPGLPDATQALIAQVAALLASTPAGQPLDASLLAPVTTLLRDLAGTSGVPSDVGALLTNLADLLGGGGATPGLPVDALALPSQLVAQLEALLRTLVNGQQPTGAVLAPVGELLDSVAATPDLPAAVSDLLSGLADQLRSTTGALDPLLADQLQGALGAIAATPGLSPGTSTTIERIATQIGQQGAGGAATARRRAATKRDRAVIKRIRVNRARTRISVRIACPRSAPAACATVVRASLAGHKAAQGKRARIGAGHAKVVRLRVVRAARTASARHGGRLRVRVVTAFGAQRFAAAKAVRVRKQR